MKKLLITDILDSPHAIITSQGKKTFYHVWTIWDSMRADRKSIELSFEGVENLRAPFLNNFLPLLIQQFGVAEVEANLHITNVGNKDWWAIIYEAKMYGINPNWLKERKEQFEVIAELFQEEGNQTN